MHVEAFVPADFSAEVWLKVMGQTRVCEEFFMKAVGPEMSAQGVNLRLFQDALDNASDHTRGLHRRSWLRVKMGDDMMQGGNRPYADPPPLREAPAHAEHVRCTQEWLEGPFRLQIAGGIGRGGTGEMATVLTVQSPVLHVPLSATPARRGHFYLKVLSPCLASRYVWLCAAAQLSFESKEEGSRHAKAAGEAKASRDKAKEVELSRAASVCYQHGLETLMPVYERADTVTQQALEPLLLMLYNNVAAIAFNRGRYGECLVACDLVIGIDGQNIKALIRRAKAHHKLSVHIW